MKYATLRKIEVKDRQILEIHSNRIVGLKIINEDLCLFAVEDKNVPLSKYEIRMTKTNSPFEFAVDKFDFLDIIDTDDIFDTDRSAIMQIYYRKLD